MKNRLPLLIILFCSTWFNVSAQSWLWGRQAYEGTKGILYSENVATDKTGNVYHTGNYENTITFGNYSLTTISIHDLYLVKYDTSGNVLWVRGSTTASPYEWAQGSSVATDDSDNAYITGYPSNSTVIGNYTLNDAGQMFLVKYDPLGNVKWAVQPDINLGNPWAVGADKFGHEYVTGSYGASNGVFVVMYDRNGNLKWANTPDILNSDETTYGVSVATDDLGYAYVSGQFQNTLQLGNYTLYSEYPAAFVAKFDTSGNVIWVNQSTHNTVNIVFFNITQGLNTFVAADREGDAYITYTFRDSIGFGPYVFTSPLTSNYSFFVVKYNPSGSIAWAKQAYPIGSSFNGGCGTYSMSTDDSNHLFISGAFGDGQLYPDFVFSGDTISATDTVSGDTPAFLLKLDSAGNVICSSTLPASGDEQNSITSDSTGRFVYLAGIFSSSFTLGNDTLTNHSGVLDTYVGRWQPCDFSCNIDAVVTPQSTNICSGQSITLIASGGTDYTWSPSEGLNTTTGDTVIATPATSTTYTVDVKTTGWCNTTASIPVTVIPAPNKPFVTVSITGDSLISSAKSYNQWYFNGNLMPNDTSKVLVIKGLPKGWYSVTVTNPANGCSTTSDSTTSINQLSVISEQLSIYPNPFNNSVFVKINSSAQNVNEWNFQITDVLGRTVFTKQSLNYNNEIDLSDLPSGMYFISVINKTGKAVVPMVKQ